MTRSLFTLAYPVLSAADKAMIRAFRVEHDRPKVYRVEPHFTIAFGASGVDDDDYLEHVRKIAAALHPITFHCRYAMLGADENSDTSYIFLVPDEGNSALSLLHDRLYSGLLASCLRIDLPYVPHITIGRCSERQKAKELCDELNARPLSIAGSVEALTVALMVDDIIKNLRSFELTARRRLKKLDSRDTLGLKKNLNILVDYDPSWEIAFIEERKLLARVLGEVAQGIEHYGSTAVPGMRAKPILDILVGVSPLDDWAKCKDPLESLGYDYAANAGVPGHHIFGRGRDSSERTHLVHVVKFLGEEWCGNLALRDALRRNASLRGTYLQVKERAAAASPEGRARYNELKGPFLAQVKARLK